METNAWEQSFEEFAEEFASGVIANLLAADEQRLSFGWLPSGSRYGICLWIQHKDGEYLVIAQTRRSGCGNGRVKSKHSTFAAALCAADKLLPRLSLLHKTRVRRGLLQGHPLLDKVRENYPDLAEINWLEASIAEDRKYNGLADWEMTSAEMLMNASYRKDLMNFRRMVWRETPWDKIPDFDVEARELHRCSVKSAVDRGKPVPEKVLAEYAEVLSL